MGCLARRRCLQSSSIIPASWASTTGSVSVRRRLSDSSNNGRYPCPSNGPGSAGCVVTAILQRDILLVQGGVVFVAACYVFFNILVDVAQSLLDPRIKT